MKSGWCCFAGGQSEGSKPNPYQPPSGPPGPPAAPQPERQQSAYAPPPYPPSSGHICHVIAIACITTNIVLTHSRHLQLTAWPLSLWSFVHVALYVYFCKLTAAIAIILASSEKHITTTSTPFSALVCTSIELAVIPILLCGQRLVANSASPLLSKE